MISGRCNWPWYGAKTHLASLTLYSTKGSVEKKFVRASTPDASCEFNPFTAMMLLENDQ